MEKMLNDMDSVWPFVAELLSLYFIVFVSFLLSKDMSKDKNDEKPKNDREVFEELLGELYGTEPTADDDDVVLKTSEMLSCEFSGFVTISTFDVTNVMCKMGYKMTARFGHPDWLLYRKEEDGCRDM